MLLQQNRLCLLEKDVLEWERQTVQTSESGKTCENLTDLADLKEGSKKQLEELLVKSRSLLKEYCRLPLAQRIDISTDFEQMR
jgi:hypothetical protein